MLLRLLLPAAKPVLCHEAVGFGQIINGGSGLGGVAWFVAEPGVDSSKGCQKQVDTDISLLIP